MPSYDVTELIERARSASDMRDNFVTQTEWLRWLNVEHRMLTLALTRLGYTRDITTQTHAADGTGTFAVTDDELMAVVGLYEAIDGRSRWLKYEPYIKGTLALDTQAGQATHYAVEQTGDAMTVSLYPQPASGTYRLLYYPSPDTLVLETPAAGEDDAVWFPMGFEERLVLGLARRALAKEGSNTSELGRQIREIDAHIEAAASSRQLSGAVVRNMDKVERGWGVDVPGPEAWVWL